MAVLLTVIVSVCTGVLVILVDAFTVLLEVTFRDNVSVEMSSVVVSDRVVGIGGDVGLTVVGGSGIVAVVGGTVTCCVLVAMCFLVVGICVSELLDIDHGRVAFTDSV